MHPVGNLFKELQLTTRAIRKRDLIFKRKNPSLSISFPKDTGLMPQLYTGTVTKKSQCKDVEVTSQNRLLDQKENKN